MGQKPLSRAGILQSAHLGITLKMGDTVYFKNSGEKVSVKAQVKKLWQFICLKPDVKKILNKYGKDIGMEKKDAAEFARKFRDKKYCILIFLTQAKKIKPFEINKKGFGAMASWITVEKIKNIAVWKKY